MKIEVKEFNELRLEELYEIFRLRSEVFVVEQECIYNDIDGKDLDSVHIMIKDEGRMQAYLRVIKQGVSYEDCSIGRVLVAKEARGKGLARRIVSEGIRHITKVWNEKRITIGAQEYLKGFYESLGFKGMSDVYMEDGIPHMDMRYEKE